MLRPKMSKIFKYRYLMTAMVIVLYYILFNSISADSALPKTNNFLSVNAIAIPHQDITIEKQYVGYIIPIQSADIAANIAGYIDDVMVEGGSEVKIGDNLVLIDQREYKAEWESAKAATVKAKADYNNALSYYKRMKKAGNKAISASELDNAKAAYLAAQAAVEQAKAIEQKAKITYDYTVVQAPIEGIVGNIDLTKGNYITPNSKLFSIVQFDPIRVVFAVPDKDFMQFGENVLRNEQIKLRLADGQLYEQTGHFQYSDNQVNKSTNSISLYADFANPQKKLLVNSYVDVLLLKSLKDIALIRQNYAQIKDDGIWAYIVNNNSMKQIKLQVEGVVDNFYVVSNQFNPDEYLVVDRIGQIAPNTKLKVNVKKSGEK